jgi:hypothetical protein
MPKRLTTIARFYWRMDMQNFIQTLIERKKLINIIALLSAIAMSFMIFIDLPIKRFILSLFLAAIIYFFIIFKYGFIIKTLTDTTRKYILAAMLLALFTIGVFMLKDIRTFGTVSLVWIFAFPVISLMYLWLIKNFLPSILDFFKNLSKTDKYYLIIKMIIMVILIAIAFSLTSVFYAPSNSEGIIDYNAIHNTDTGKIIRTDAYFEYDAPQNDLRQPLFGVYGSQIAIVAKILSAPLFFIDNIYPITSAIVQVFLIELVIIMIGLLLKLKGKLKLMFSLLLSVSYPYLLFSFNMEQYVLSTFWLVTFVYAAINSKKHAPYLFIGATGSMLTSGALFPLFFKDKPFKQGIIIFIKTMLTFGVLLILFGKISIIINVFEDIVFLSHFTDKGSLTLADKLLQYHHFIKNLVIPSHTQIAMHRDGFMSYSFIIPTGFSIISAIISVLAILGFALNRKDSFAKTCGLWVLVSIILLCVAGWGSMENGYILYTLYFSWAYLSLCFMALKKLIPNDNILFYILLAAVVAFMVFNIPEMLKMVRFGILHYPA